MSNIRKDVQGYGVDLSDILTELSSVPALDPCTYQYFYNLEKNRTIIFNDEIGLDIVESVMVPLLQMDNDGTGLPINILFSTKGGSLFDGMPLCDVIDNLKTPTTITVMTYAYSMGGIIIMAGYNNPNVKKRCYKHCTALLHGGSLFLDGTLSNAKDQFRFCEHYEDKIRDYTLSHSKITPEEYDRIERYEWYMTSDDMLAKGLVDEIIGVEMDTIG